MRIADLKERRAGAVSIRKPQFEIRNCHSISMRVRE
jgi:hypothetical protein